MNRDYIIKIAKEAGWDEHHCQFDTRIERFANLVAEAERDACAKECEKKETYAYPIPCPDGIEGCLVLHSIPVLRNRTSTECLEAIRARNETTT